MTQLRSDAALLDAGTLASPERLPLMLGQRRLIISVTGASPRTIQQRERRL